MLSWYKDRLLLALVSLLTLGSGLMFRSPWPPDEPRFAAVARDMVESGQWFFPSIGGHLYPDKPPVFMWLQALIQKCTGSIDLAFLLPGLLASVLAVLAVQDLAARLWNRRTAWWAAGALLLSFQFIWQAHAGQIDALLCGFTTLALYGFARHFLLGPAWGWYAASGVFMGLGVLTKGVGFLPLLALIPAGVLAWKRPAGLGWKPQSSWTHILWILAPLLMILTIAAWLVPMVFQVAHAHSTELCAYRDEILGRQTVDRYAKAWHHHKAFWYYLPTLLLMWVPLTLLLPWCIMPLWRRLRRLDKNTVFFLGTSALIILFFSLSAGKRGVYILPALPAFALAIAPLLPGLARRREIRIFARSLLVFLGLATLCAAAGILCFEWVKDLSFLAKYQDRFQFLAQGTQRNIAACGFLIAGWIILRLAWRRAFALKHFGLALASAWIAIPIGLWPWLDPQLSSRALMRQINQVVIESGGTTLGMVDWREQMYLQAVGQVRTFAHRAEGEQVQREFDDAIRWLAQDPGNRLLIAKDRAETMKTTSGCTLDLSKSYDLGRHNRMEWCLVGPTAIRE